MGELFAIVLLLILLGVVGFIWVYGTWLKYEPYRQDWQERGRHDKAQGWYYETDNKHFRKFYDEGWHEDDQDI